MRKVVRKKKFNCRFKKEATSSLVNNHMGAAIGTIIHSSTKGIILLALAILVIAWWCGKKQPKRNSSSVGEIIVTETIVVFLLGNDPISNSCLAKRMLKEAANPALVRFVLPPGSSLSLEHEPVGLAGLPARRCCSLPRETFFVACGPSVFRVIPDWDDVVRNLSQEGCIMSHSLVASRRASAEPNETVLPLRQCSIIKNEHKKWRLIPCHEIFFGWGAFGQTMERVMLCWENNPWWGLALALAAEKENKKIRDVGPNHIVALRGPESRQTRWGGTNRLGVLRARIERIAGRGTIFPEDEDFSLVRLTIESSNTSN